MSSLETDIIAEILPATETSILAGASGAGKTTLLMHVVKCLQNGEPVFGHPTRQGMKIGYLAADRTWDAYARLAKVVGVDIDKLYVRALIDDKMLTEDDLDGFERDPQTIMYSLLKDMVAKGVNLVIADPLVVLLGSDINTYHKVAARMIRLNRFCKMNNLTILGTHHANKARTDFSFKRPQDRISGTSALLGFSSTQLCLLPKEETQEGKFAEWHIVSHHAKAKVIYLDRCDQTGVFKEHVQWDGIAEVDISAFNEVAH